METLPAITQMLTLVKGETSGVTCHYYNSILDREIRGPHDKLSLYSINNKQVLQRFKDARCLDLCSPAWRNITALCQLCRLRCYVMLDSQPPSTGTGWLPESLATSASASDTINLNHIRQKLTSYTTYTTYLSQLHGQQCMYQGYTLCTITTHAFQTHWELPGYIESP